MCLVLDTIGVVVDDLGFGYTQRGSAKRDFAITDKSKETVSYLS